MKILVCLKQVPHQDARLDVRSDGTWIQEENIKFEINSYDTYALEEALRVKDKGETEVVVASIGPERVTQALRTALGMGADRAVHVKDAAVDGSDALGIAKTLAAVAKAENPDLVLMGLMSEDGNAASVPPMLAQLLDLPSATGVMSVEHQNGNVRVEREIPPDLPPVLADGEALRRALRNLIENAVRHGGSAGWVGVQARRRDHGIEITVSDRGPGIRREDLPHLFEPFYRGRETQAKGVPGSGLDEDLVRLLVARGVRQAEGGHTWSSDQRLTLPTMVRMTEPQVENLVAGIECPTLAIFADPAQPYLPDALRRRRVALMPRASLVTMPGGHHLHMQQPAEVAAAIGDFLAG